MFASCSSDDKDVKQGNDEQAEVSQKSDDKPVTEIEEVAGIDSTWNYYTGTVGMYDSQIIMELSFNGEDVNGSYWYSKHKKRLKLHGTFNEKDQTYSLTESISGKNTGGITFKKDGNNIIGKWQAPDKSFAAEAFFCEKVVTESDKHMAPKFQQFEFSHQIEVYNSEVDDMAIEDASDYLSLVKLNSEKFVFIYNVIGHNYHTGNIGGIGTYLTPGLGQFKGDEGCRVEFQFFDDHIEITEEVSCDYYKGHRAYFGGTLTRK